MAKRAVLNFPKGHETQPAAPLPVLVLAVSLVLPSVQTRQFADEGEASVAEYVPVGQEVHPKFEVHPLGEVHPLNPSVSL